MLLFMIMMISACNKAVPGEAAPTERIMQEKSSTSLSERTKPDSTTPESTAVSSSQSTNSTIEKFKKRGYQVEEKHIFTREFEDIGKLTVTPVTTFDVNNDSPISLILTGDGKEIVLTPSRENGFPMFSSFEAISFKDIDDYSLKSGYTDIIVIANFVTGVGPQGMEPFSDVFIFRNNAWGGFEEDIQLEDRIKGGAGTRTLTMKQVFKLAKPFDMNKFIGTFKKRTSSKYDGSEITIKRIEEDKIYFSLDAFHVNSGDKGIKTGNVNVGNIEDGVAALDWYAAAYKPDDSDFKLIFKFFGNDTFEVTEEGSPIFGANVYASGMYKRDKR